MILVAPKEEQIQAFNDLDKGEQFVVHTTTADVDVTDPVFRSRGSAGIGGNPPAGLAKHRSRTCVV